ncbi:inositol-pentakisphosphate 2-kinase [Ceratobasidium sp. AG-Ba]|nr:inositol-pentakisphosphate 2-kinase [Ceratobasidium sp. AG-Ba]
MNGRDSDDRHRLTVESTGPLDSQPAVSSPTVIGQVSVPWTPVVGHGSAPWTPVAGHDFIPEHDEHEGPLPNLSSTHPRHWKYISEGGATIVFSYRGPPHKVFSNSVLRLRKAVRATPAPEEHKEIGIGNSDVVDEKGAIVKPLEIAEDQEQKIKARGSNESLRSVRSAHSSRSLHHHRSSSNVRDDDSDSDWEDLNPDLTSENEQPDDPTIAFQTRVTSRLVPLCFLPRLESARVGRRWVEELARIGEKARPEARRRVDGIDLERRKGVLADDLVGWLGWAVEIKPKWAFLPNPTHLSAETAPFKLSRCRFCMHGYHSSRAGKEKGGYCPLDLFSGDLGRIKKALGALWDTWIMSNGSINNLKLFVMGKTVKPKSDPPFDYLSPFLRSTNGEEGMREAFVEAIAPMLHSSPLLGTLSTLMRSLDALDIEGVEKLWKEAKHVAMVGLSPKIADDEDEPSLADWEKFVDEYLAHGPYVGTKERYDPNEPQEENLKYWLTSYLMSATFKDCSIMLRFSPGLLDGTESFTNPERDVSMPLLTAIDLDPKSMKRLQKWAELDRDIVQHYAAADRTGDDGQCVDARVVGAVGKGVAI